MFSYRHEAEKRKHGAPEAGRSSTWIDDLSAFARDPLFDEHMERIDIRLEPLPGAPGEQLIRLDYHRDDQKASAFPIALLMLASLAPVVIRRGQLPRIDHDVANCVVVLRPEVSDRSAVEEIGARSGLEPAAISPASHDSQSNTGISSSETQITEQMIDAGIKALWASHLEEAPEVVSAVFLAMVACRNRQIEIVGVDTNFVEAGQDANGWRLLKKDGPPRITLSDGSVWERLEAGNRTRNVEAGLAAGDLSPDADHDFLARGEAQLRQFVGQRGGEKNAGVALHDSIGHPDVSVLRPDVQPVSDAAGSVVVNDQDAEATQLTDAPHGDTPPRAGDLSTT